MPYKEEINFTLSKRRDSNGEVDSQDASNSLMRKRPTSFMKNRRRGSEGIA